jgi:hypothetical protein
MIYFDGEEEKVKEFEIFAGDDDDVDIEIVSVKQSDEDDGIISFNPDEPEEPEFDAFGEGLWDEADEPEYILEDEPEHTSEDEPESVPEDEPKYMSEDEPEYDPFSDLQPEKEEKEYEPVEYVPEEDEPTGFGGFGDENDESSGLDGESEEPKAKAEEKRYVPTPQFDVFISDMNKKQEDVKEDVIKKDEEEKVPYEEEEVLDDENVEYYVANKKDYEQEKMFIIDGVKIIMEASKSLKQTSADKPAVRHYNKKKPKRRKAKFTKEKKEGNAFGTFIKVVVIALIIGTFLGTKGLAYYNTYGTKKTTPSQACFGWFTKDVPVTLQTVMPFNAEVFLTGLGIGAGAFLMIAVFVYLDKDQKKESRIGHEHGKARLATMTDYKQYTRNFMT